jgi:hypothetical protein
MPYIKPIDRHEINKLRLAAITPQNGGELQWIIAELIHAYILEKGLNYQHCQDMMGALAGAQAEFYREVVAPYENIKKRDNGIVYLPISEYSAPNKSLTKQTY